ncbi:MAG: membrane lipoprotein lipid attachment site-containing protein [Erysipelothrix sp.]
MKKVLTVLLAVFLLTGCSGGNNKLSSKWSDDQISINGKVISMSMSFDEILKKTESVYSTLTYGLIPKDVKVADIEFEYAEAISLKMTTKKALDAEEHGSIEFLIVNPKESKQNMTKSIPLMIDIDMKNLDDFKSTEIEFPGGIKPRSKRDDVIKAYGDEYKEYGSSTIIYILEEVDKGGKSDHVLQLKFNSEDELQGYQLINSQGVDTSKIKEHKFK